MQENLTQQRHYAVLQKLGLAQWQHYDTAAINQGFAERPSRHLQHAVYNIAGLSINCTPGIYHPDVNSSSVFILRHLLDKALFKHSNPSLLEIGTGCGVIILALKQFLQQGQFVGLDIDTDSLSCATANALDNNLEVTFLHSDLFAQITDKRYDYIIFNAPFHAAEVTGELAPALITKLCDYRGQLLTRFVTQLPNYLTTQGCAYLTIANTGNLAALDQTDLNLDLLAVERYNTGFFRAMVRLTLIAN